MTDQLYIGDDGQIDSQPLTWDREPLYSPSTVAEGLFDRDAFAQIPGQLDIERMMGEAWDGPGGFWENRERST